MRKIGPHILYRWRRLDDPPAGTATLNGAAMDADTCSLLKSADASVAAAAKRRHCTVLAKVERPWWVNMADQNAGERDVVQLFFPDSTATQAVSNDTGAASSGGRSG